MSLTLAQLTTPLTATEVREAIYTGLSNSGVTTTDWKPGATTRTIIAVVAVVLAALSSLTAFIAKSGFLELSSGDWLDLVALYIYDVEREPDTFATGTVTLVNSGAGVFNDVQPGDLIVQHSTSKKTYRNTAVFSLGASGSLNDEVTVAIQADEAGSDSNAIVGAISTFVTTFVGVTCSNQVPLVGSDRELDPALRARCRAKTGVLSPNGPRDAYTYLALSAKRADGSSIGVTRVRSIADGLGGVDVYVADPDGSVTGTVGDEGTDLGIVDRDIQEQAAPLAITARLHAASPAAIAVTYEIWMRDTSGLSDDEIKEQIDDALLVFFAAEAIGGDVVSPAAGKVYRSAVLATITTVVRPYLIRADLTLPAADVELDIYEAPILGAVIGVVHQLPVGSL